MVSIETQVSEGSLREKTVTAIDYEVEHPKFNVSLSKDAVYTFTVGNGIHTDLFGLYRNGTGKEIVGEELDVSFEEPTFLERIKIALAILFPSIAERYGAVLTKQGLRDEQIQALQPTVDQYNVRCGIGIQCEYAHPRIKEERVIPTSEASLVDKL